MAHEVFLYPGSYDRCPSCDGFKSKRSKRCLSCWKKLIGADERRRRAYQLRYVEGKKFKEIGQLLGVSLERARQICGRSYRLFGPERA